MAQALQFNIWYNLEKPGAPYYHVFKIDFNGKLEVQKHDRPNNFNEKN